MPEKPAIDYDGLADRVDDLVDDVTDLHKDLARVTRERDEARAQATKRLGVAGIIRKSVLEPHMILFGRRLKDPNRGMWVVPGGGVHPGEGLDEALHREVREETGCLIYIPEMAWERPCVVDLDDRVIIFVRAVCIEPAATLATPAASDLGEVHWVNVRGDKLTDVSPVVLKALDFYELGGVRGTLSGLSKRALHGAPDPLAQPSVRRG